MATHQADSLSLTGDAQSESHVRRSLSARELGHLIFVALPPLVLVALIAVGVGYRQDKQNRVRAAVAELAREDVPVGNHSLTTVFDRRTKPAASQQWREVFTAIDELNARFSPLVSQRAEDSLRLVPPDQQWPVAPVAKQYAGATDPIVGRLERLVESPQPVWQPVIFSGFSTLLPELQESRGVTRTLDRRFRSAFHQGDHERALGAIELSARIPDAFDWQFCMIGELVYFALRDQPRQMIRESMLHDFWTIEELRRLDALLNPTEDLDAHWRNSLAGERAMALAATRSDGGVMGQGITPYEFAALPFGVPASIRLDYIRQVDQLGDLRGAGTLRHARRVAEIQERFSGKTDLVTGIAGIPLADARDVTHFWSFGSWDRFSKSFARHSMRRRWTRCAVAIKRFQLQQGRWPHDLTELTEVGLSRADWQAVEGIPFGYQVREDGAVLWTVEPSALGEPISSAPPSEEDADRKDLERLEIRIR